MKKSISLCEFSTTPSVSLMKGKDGVNHATRDTTGTVQTNQPAESKQAQKPQKADDANDDPFALEGM